MPRIKYKPIFYIAHTFGERHFVRDEFIPKLHKLGIETINPFYNSDGTWMERRPEVRFVDEGGESAEWAKIVKSKSVNIVDTDLDLIRKADGIIAFMPEGSTGTTCEIWICGGVFKWLEKIGYSIEEFLNKPVFLVTTSSRLLMHPWLKYATVRMFRSDEAFLKYLKKMLPKMRQKLKKRREKLIK